MQKLVDFIKNRPALKASTLEAEAGIPKRALWNALRGHQGLSTKHAWRLCEILCQYGLEIDGWKFNLDNDINAFIVEKKIEDRESEVKEIEDGTRTHYEYHVPMYRHIIGDEPELIDWL